MWTPVPGGLASDAEFQDNMQRFEDVDDAWNRSSEFYRGMLSEALREASGTLTESALREASGTVTVSANSGYSQVMYA